MTTNQSDMTSTQVDFFNRFLLTGTGNALNVLESIFLLNIDSSDSSIEVASAVNSKKIDQLGDTPLYGVSSLMEGELQGNLHLLIHSEAFERLGEVMRPILKLLFLSSPDTNLVSADGEMPDWMQDDGTIQLEESVFFAQMMDVLVEMGNVLFGVYTSAIYKTYDLHTYHSLPESLKDPIQKPISEILSSQEIRNQHHLVIENEFSVRDETIKFWCLISPTQKSFQELVNRIE